MLATVTSKGQITIPANFRRKLKIGDDTILRLTLKNGIIEMIPLHPISQGEMLREYDQDEIESFIKEDRLSSATAAKIRRLLGRKRHS